MESDWLEIPLLGLNPLKAGQNSDCPSWANRRCAICTCLNPLKAGQNSDLCAERRGACASHSLNPLKAGQNFDGLGSLHVRL